MAKDRERRWRGILETTEGRCDGPKSRPSYAGDGSDSAGLDLEITRRFCPVFLEDTLLNAAKGEIVIRIVVVFLVVGNTTILLYICKATASRRPFQTDQDLPRQCGWRGRLSGGTARLGLRDQADCRF